MRETGEGPVKQLLADYDVLEKALKNIERLGKFDGIEQAGHIARMALKEVSMAQAIDRLADNPSKDAE